MFKRWRLGSLLGFPVEVNLSFLLLLGVVFLWLGGLAGIFVVGLSFGSVLLHELGHAVVARQLGVLIAGIEQLHFFGGAAKMVDLPKKASHEIGIALAGPAVSLMLAGAGLGLGALLHSPLIAMIGWINAIIAGFNLIPALPMDGGRVLRAALTRKYDFVRATDISVKVAQVVAVGFVIAGLAGMTQLLILAPFLWLMGVQERILARQIAHRFAYDQGGYVQRHGEPEVVRGRWGEAGWQSQARRGGPRFVIRDHRGVWVVEME